MAEILHGNFYREILFAQKVFFMFNFKILRKNNEKVVLFFSGCNYGSCPTILQLQYDGTSHYGPAYSSKYTDFWVTCIYNKPVKGCGIFLQWDTNGKASYFFTNNEKLGANVRLVRTLTKWQ